MVFNWHLLDTWPAWRQTWDRVAHAPLEMQIDAWAMEYMALYPALFEKQVDNYASLDMDWRAVARDRVFPSMTTRMPHMTTAHDTFLRCHDAVARRFGDHLQADFSCEFVVYVGLECGAGWATTYEGTPACLLGLEAIANLGWQTETQLAGLITHELGHLAHIVWRARAGVSDLEESESDPLFLLYSEGFAQRVEHVALGQDRWHMRDERGNWLAWCRDREGWLAGEFLRRVDAGEPVRDFFGSWFAIEGHSQAGYYLGHQIVCTLERDNPSLQAIAVWPEEQVHRQVRQILRSMASEG